MKIWADFGLPFKKKKTAQATKSAEKSENVAKMKQGGDPRGHCRRGTCNLIANVLISFWASSNSN
jgi:hypothetical protein